MRKPILTMLLAILALTATACQSATTTTTAPVETTLNNATIYEVNIRNYTEAGTFDAFAEHLPRLKELGVDILWLMPIHPISETRRIGSLGSWYAVADYFAVNPEYGTDEDFRELVDAAHELGFSIILDWVANHTGWDHPWINAHPDWYTQDGEGNITIPSGTNWNDVADLNYLNFDMRAEMIAALSYWVTEFDIDGYRCDYAGGVPRTFWEAARTELDAIKPLFWLAEDDSQFGLLENAFMANYAFAMMNTINGVGHGSHDAEDVRAMLELNAARYPAGRFPLYYATNHDVNAWEGSIPDLLGAGEFALATLVFTIPGMPLIYSGQEVGLDRELRFFDKDEIDWTGWETNETFRFYQKLTALKKQHPALWHGLDATLDFLSNDDPDVLVYARTSGTSRVVVILNLSKTSRFLTVSLPGMAGTYLDYFEGETITLEETMPIRLDPWDYRVFVLS